MEHIPYVDLRIIRRTFRHKFHYARTKYCLPIKSQESTLALDLPLDVCIGLTTDQSPVDGPLDAMTVPVTFIDALYPDYRPKDLMKYASNRFLNVLEDMEHRAWNTEYL
jgi:hypothetical protein